MFQIRTHADHRCLTRPRLMLVFEVVGGSEQSICACDGFLDQEVFRLPSTISR